MLSFVILGAIDIPLISEMKIDFQFPTSTFVKNGNSNIFKWSLNENRDELMLLVKIALLHFLLVDFVF